MLAAETMNGHTFHIGKLRHAAIGVVAVALACVSYAQTPPPPPASTAAAPAAPAGKTFSQEQLEQLVAPIALHPDSLLAQMLMASTYPLDIVMADRWVKANPKVKDKALEDAMQKQPWDPNVKGLTAVPQALAMMSEKLEWTQQLGDAFLAQRQELMAAVQKLRQKASAQGNLKESKEQKVITEQVAQQTVIKIEPADPQVVYVPSYNPTVVYGAWPYPAYPPYYYPPAPYYGYYAGAGLVGFTAGVIVGGAIWGNANWGGGDVDIDVNKSNNFNRTNNSNRNFQHNPERRGGVPYKDQRTAQQYNRGQSPNAGTRDDFRGRDGQIRSGRRSLWRSRRRSRRYVIVQEIAPVIVAAIVRPALAIAVPIRVTSEAPAQAHVMSAAVRSAVMSAAAVVISAAVERAPARRIAAAAATLVAAVATMVQAARRLAAARVRVRAAAAAAARPAWRVRVAAAEAERARGGGGRGVEVGDDKPLNHASIATRRKAGDDQPYSLSIQTCVASAALVLCTLGISTAFAATPAQRTFASAEEAATALVQAVKKGDRAAILAVLGKDAASSLSPEMPSTTV